MTPPPTSSATPPGGEQPVVLHGRYRLERRLAQGGMAEVWLATDLALDRKVALKWLKPSLATDPVVAERFRREAVAVAGLNHPNIVAVHDVFEDQHRQAVVMQLVDGKSLRQLLDVQTRLSPELTIHVGTCVAAALDAAHRAGFVHRDVKPGNILITPDGRVLLTDFGIAKGLDTSGDDLTSDNVMMGTAKYLSPEQVRGKKLDGRADLYSLGLVLYECLAGRVPFQGETDADTALARLQRDPTDLGRLRPTVPRGLVDLIHRLLARNPNHRPATGAELRAALLQVADEPPSEIDLTPLSAPPEHPPPPARDRRTSIGAPAIPGEATPPRATRQDAAVARDHTPAAGPRLRGSPARGLQQRVTPSLVVVGLLLLAAGIVAAVLWATLGTGREGAGATTLAPGQSTAPAAPSGVVRITDVAVFDPDGDGSEDTDPTAALGDGDGWHTLCYQSRFMGGKSGVGVAVTLSAPSAGTVSFDVASAPYLVSVFASAAENAPATVAEWGTPVLADDYGEQPATIEASVPQAARHLLVMFRELGVDGACSAANPYRGRLGAITFVP